MTRRPLLFFAAGYSAAVLFSYYIGAAEGVLLATGCVAITVFVKRITLGGKGPAIFAAALLIGALGFAWASCAEDALCDRASDEPGAFVGIRGTVRQMERKTNDQGESYRQLVVMADAVDEEPVKSRVLVRYYGDEELGKEVIPGACVQIAGTIDLPKQKRNPGCFDYRLYLRSLGIRTVMTAQRIEPAVDGKHSLLRRAAGTFAGRLYVYKEAFLERLSAQADPKTTTLLRAILFGEKGELDEDVMESFRRNGTAHILAVSGLHVGIIYAFLLKLLSLIPVPAGGRSREWLFLGLIGSFFLCYMILASFSPSVVRAVVMVLLHAFAKSSGRRYDLNSAAFAVFIAVLVHNPFMLFNTGFQMSFLSVLSMCLIIPFVKKLYSGILLASLSVQIGLGPFVMYHFHVLSLLAVFINVPVILLAGILVPAGLCYAALTPLLGGAAVPLAKFLQLLCDTLTELNALTAVDGFTTFTVPSPDVRWLFFYYLCLLCLASEEGRLRVLRAVRGRVDSGTFASALAKSLAKPLVAILALTLGLGWMVDDGFSEADITFVDVGQGDCVCVRYSEGLLGLGQAVYLFDGGGSENYSIGKNVLREYLLKSGVAHVDGAFVTHLHTDHYKGICELAREGMVDRLYVYEGYHSRESEICRDTGLTATQITYLYAGQRVVLQGGGGRESESDGEVESDGEGAGGSGGQAVGTGRGGSDDYSGSDDGLVVDVLWPERKTDAEYQRLLADETNENAMSLLLKVTDGGVSMLVTGDMDEEGEKAVIARHQRDPDVLRSDILKVGHHGSKASSSDIFINYVNPRIAVIQVGKNIYGHPTPEAIERLTRAGAAIYRNDQQGAIGVWIKRGEIKQIMPCIN